MGIYFIPAGTFSKNRLKTLDKPHAVGEICQFLSPKERDELKKFFNDTDAVYIWGAGQKSFSELSQVNRDEYVVDVKNTKVIQIFKYCFFIKAQNTRLRDVLGWDKEKNSDSRRSIDYVYFLKSPIPTRRKTKTFFQTAFNLTSNSQWLIGQKYFTDNEVRAALKRTSCVSIEAFLGITNGLPNLPKNPNRNNSPGPAIIIRRSPSETADSPTFDIPAWLEGLVGKVIALKNDPGHLERDHEDLVAALFELLGYQRIHDIKFRRGNIDIRIEKDNSPMITVEVKSDWGLSPDSRGALSQAYNYAHETGTPFVIITNGDRFCIYDRRQGMSYIDNLFADVTLTCMTQEAVNKLFLLRKDNIK
jgi:Type I restriction enzyme R protein N terminus (HSDR_N)